VFRVMFSKSKKILSAAYFAKQHPCCIREILFNLSVQCMFAAKTAKLL